MKAAVWPYFLFKLTQIRPPPPILITELSEESSYFNKEEGGFDVVKLNITLKEYIENPKLYNQLIEQRKIQKNQQVTEENQDDIENEQKEAVNNDNGK